ncbi:hypothetical protein llap_21625 [Limosa lapponica baueri]|uniref:S1 motif domain-containing protein n=1 Tax=Limosa lapponica baueri TaxID=1758121 RepID=A0A2I0T2Q0_LIMLA|nr:hypothetical protein llap_21625 [Limosa lapponica baueri]
MASMEENFPRGGIQKKPTEGKTPNLKVERDNLFDVHHEEQSQKRKRSQSDQGKQKKFKADRTAAAKDSVVNIEPLSIEDLNSLSDMYSPGTLVRCIVTSVEKSADGRRSIKLSIDPKKVNKGLNASALASGMLLSGSVSSVEDHGYLIDIGVRGAHAFLPRQKAQNYIKAVKREDLNEIGSRWSLCELLETAVFWLVCSKLLGFSLVSAGCVTVPSPSIPSGSRLHLD